MHGPVDPSFFLACPPQNTKKFTQSPKNEYQSWTIIVEATDKKGLKVKFSELKICMIPLTLVCVFSLHNSCSFNFLITLHFCSGHLRVPMQQFQSFYCNRMGQVDKLTFCWSWPLLTSPDKRKKSLHHLVDWKSKWFSFYYESLIFICDIIS